MPAQDFWKRSPISGRPPPCGPRGTVVLEAAALLTAADQAALTAAFAPAGKSLYAEPGIIARICGDWLALIPN